MLVRFGALIRPSDRVAMSTVQADQPPKTVFLFSGHMIDAPDRKTTRFPPDKEPVAATAIANTLAEIGVAEGDLAICGGACGGDLLFAEACLARSMRLEIYIPFDEPTFLAHSVDFVGGNWHDRYLAAKLRATLHVMPDELGPLPADENAYERNNRWMLKSAARLATIRLLSSHCGMARAVMVLAERITSWRTCIEKPRASTGLIPENCGIEGSATCPCVS